MKSFLDDQKLLPGIIEKTLWCYVRRIKVKGIANIVDMSIEHVPVYQHWTQIKNVKE